MGKNFKFLSLYRSPSQNRDEFEKFLENLELSIDHMGDENRYMMVLLGDFNAKSNSSYADDTTTIEGSNIDILTASFGFNEIKNEPTHILNNSSSCIDLIFHLILHGLQTTKSSNRIRCSFFSPRKLSPSNNICKV